LELCNFLTCFVKTTDIIYTIKSKKPTRNGIGNR
jgi:hypothetical protein